MTPRKKGKQEDIKTEDKIEEEKIDLKEDKQETAKHNQPKFKLRDNVFCLSGFENKFARENGTSAKYFTVVLGISVHQEKDIYKQRESGQEWKEHQFRLKKAQISVLKNLLEKAELEMISSERRE